MGLAERRAMEAAKTKLAPKFDKDVAAAAGTAVKLDIDWDSLAVEGYEHIYEEGITKIFLDPLKAALKAIAADDMGKKALKAGLKKIVIKNSDRYSASTGFSFEGGVLTLDHRTASNIDDVDPRTEALQKLLEKNL